MGNLTTKEIIKIIESNLDHYVMGDSDSDPKEKYNFILDITNELKTKGDKDG